MRQQATIGIDARLSGTKNAGLGRYIKNLCLRLPLQAPPDYRFVYFLADKTQWSELIGKLAAVPLPRGLSVQAVLGRVETVWAPIRHYSLAEQTRWPKVLAGQQLDLLHVPHFNLPYLVNSPKIVLTIHDLLWHEKKGAGVTTLGAGEYWLKYLGYKAVTAHAVRAASAIITPSSTIKQTLTHFYPRAASKVSVIPNGVSDFDVVTPAAHLPAPLPPEFLLYVGSLYPHKNVQLLTQALGRRPDLRLVIVSARDAFWQRLEKELLAQGVREQVIFLGRVSDGQLKYLYQHALALVQPSRSEGFGLTGIEAMNCRCPVLASDIPVFREIYGEAFVPFDPDSVESFLAALTRLEQLDWSGWTKTAREHAARYSWEAMTAQVLAVYEQVLGGDGSNG